MFWWDPDPGCFREPDTGPVFLNPLFYGRYSLTVGSEYGFSKVGSGSGFFFFKNSDLDQDPSKIHKDLQPWLLCMIMMLECHFGARIQIISAPNIDSNLDPYPYQRQINIRNPSRINLLCRIFSHKDQDPDSDGKEIKGNQ